MNIARLKRDRDFLYEIAEKGLTYKGKPVHCNMNVGISVGPRYVSACALGAIMIRDYSYIDRLPGGLKQIVSVAHACWIVLVKQRSNKHADSLYAHPHNDFRVTANRMDDLIRTAEGREPRWVSEMRVRQQKAQTEDNYLRLAA